MCACPGCAYSWCTDAEGFNLWYLISNEESEGNMFVAQTPSLTDQMPPIRFEFLPSGAVQVVHNEGGIAPRVCREYGSISELSLRFSYVDARPGECLVMSKRTLHMSDPRPHLAGRPVNRLALNMRVLFKPRGFRTVGLNPSYPHNSSRPAYRQVMDRAELLPRAYECVTTDRILCEDENGDGLVGKTSACKLRCCQRACKHVPIDRHELVPTERR